MFSGNWLPSDAAKGVVSALERTGDAITKSATKAAQASRSSKEETSEAESKPQDEEVSSSRKEMMGKLRGGWSSVMEVTKSAIENTREAVEKEQSRFFAPKGPYKRDPKLPLDVDALRDAEVVYVTDRLITMSHPAMQSPVDGDITPDRKLAAVGHLLQRRHGGRYMVWNLSEVEYDISVLEDQVLTFQFPGSPSPPLGLLLKLLISMESWLKADERNVAVVHCLTGRGRTSTVLAAFLCWTGEAGFKDVNSALDYVARCKHVSLEELTIPSQRRYVSYFANMLDGVRPSQPPLLLKRVIMSEAPKFGKGPTKPGDSQLSPDGEGGAEENALRKGCAPYLQIFKGGNLLYTTAATVKYDQDKDELPFCSVADGAISFHTERVLQGDILMRCRHLTKSGQRVSMFRAAFHTGYVPPSVLRLTKAQLDGACNDKRFPDDFFLDLIFEACDAEVASKHLHEGKEEADVSENSEDQEKKEGDSTKSAEASAKGPSIVTASEYDSMLHRDSRFWDVIAERNKRKAGKPAEEKENETWGPTIGRRREWDESKTPKKGTKGNKGEGSQEDATEQEKRPSALETFSIGEFDFLPSETDGAGEQAREPGDQDKNDSPPKERDELMEALMAIDDDAGLSPDAVPKKVVEVETEEIVFDTGPDEAPQENKPNATVPESSAKKSDEVSSEAGQASVHEEAAEVTEPSKQDDAVQNLLADADLDLDADVDAFLSSAQDGGGDADGATENMDDLLNFEDDEDLEDLENFLTQSSK